MELQRESARLRTEVSRYQRLLSECQDMSSPRDRLRPPSPTKSPRGNGVFQPNAVRLDGSADARGAVSGAPTVPSGSVHTPTLSQPSLQVARQSSLGSCSLPTAPPSLQGYTAPVRPVNCFVPVYANSAAPSFRAVPGGSSSSVHRSDQAYVVPARPRSNSPSPPDRKSVV